MGLFFTSNVHGAAAMISGYSRRLPVSVMPAAESFIGEHLSARRGWYILRSGAEKPDWEWLGGDYFIAPWERRGMKRSERRKEVGIANTAE